MKLPNYFHRIVSPFMELREKVSGGCTTQAQLLYLLLKHIGYDPKVIRYFIKGEENKNANDRKQLTLLNGQKFPSHVVVLLDNYILDTTAPGIETKREYEEKITSKSKDVIICKKYDIKIDYDLCRYYVTEFNLSSFRCLFNWKDSNHKNF